MVQLEVSILLDWTTRMNEHQTVLVVSTVPTLGYLIMNGLVQVGTFLLCAVVLYYLTQRVGFNIIGVLRGDGPDEKPKEPKADEKPKDRPTD